jgi:hypothetical protein
MSEYEALTRFHYWCAARHTKAETPGFGRRRRVMHAQRSPLTNVLIRSGFAPKADLYFGTGR